MVTTEEGKIGFCYANSLQVNVGPLDAIIRFGTKKNRETPEGDERDYDLEVYMSPQTLKILALLVQSAVKTFDEQLASVSPQVTATKSGK